MLLYSNKKGYIHELHLHTQLLCCVIIPLHHSFGFLSVSPIPFLSINNCR